MMPAVMPAVMPTVGSAVASTMMMPAIPSMIGMFVTEPVSIVIARSDPNFLNDAAIIVAVHADPAIVCALVIEPVSIVIAWPDPSFLNHFLIRSYSYLDAGSYHRIY